MKILAFGEILWDIFPEKRVIGGAPFNFAAHCAKLGAESYLASCVGGDENGVLAIAEAKSLGIKTDYIATDRRFETGKCIVTLNDGHPSYDLASDVAYDHIPISYASGSFDALYMGTLAMRGIQSRNSFEKLLKTVSRKETLFDVNFRGNFYSRELVHFLLKETTILKISDEEIGFFGKRGNIDTLLELSKKYPKLKYICLTMGSEGAMVYDCRKRNILLSDKPKGEVLSTVGAGDSFAACFLVSFLKGLDVGQCLDRAVTLSSYVVTQLGAVPDYDANSLF